MIGFSKHCNEVQGSVETLNLLLASRGVSFGRDMLQGVVLS